MAKDTRWAVPVSRAVGAVAGLAGVSAMVLVMWLLPSQGVANESRDKKDAPATRAEADGLRPPSIPFAEVKFIIEHNATAEDTGFQAFVDGEPWNRLTVEGPDEETLLEIRARGELRTLGLTELFFETNEPPNAEVPIEELLERFPEGTYELEGRSIEGARMRGRATLSHAIPAGPVILSPAEGEVVDPDHTVIRWEPVTESITGSPVDIAGYEVIVVKDVPVNPPGFSKLVLSVHVTPSTTSLTVPREFFEPATAYQFEVLALEARGNQTISSRTFSTP